MLPYKQSAKQFIEDVRNNRLTAILSNSFYRSTGRKAGYGELSAWQNSLPRAEHLIDLASLERTMVAIEFPLPYSQQRADLMLFGKDGMGNDNIVLFELKQWIKATSEFEDDKLVGKYVNTATGGGVRIVLHPSEQVKGYHNQFKSFVQEFDKKPAINLFSCAYCHNYSTDLDTTLFDQEYSEVLRDYPLYTREDTNILVKKLKELLEGGDGVTVFNRFMRSRLNTPPKLIGNLQKLLNDEATFQLVNEQALAEKVIWADVTRGKSSRKKSMQKSVVIVHGGPGTGKSLIALHVLAKAIRKRYNVHYSCKSKPYLSGLKAMIKGKKKDLLKNLYHYLPSRAKRDQLDLLLVDEAHRIEKTSNSRYTKARERTNMPQIEQLIRAAKTVVFFIDDKQNVRAQEVGSTELIRKTASKFGITPSEITLETQFRCMGSNSYLSWLESALGYTDEPWKLKKDEVFDFQIFESPEKIYKELKKHESNEPNSARLVAGFCWPWSEIKKDGTLVKDVRIGKFRMPWEARDKGKLKKGIPRWYKWAYEPGGFNQVGCIYTAQGFEFDYIGVIVGDDLIFDPVTKTLKGNIDATCDPKLKGSVAAFDRHVKNIYRVLMTRGMKGCYVYFTNKATEKYFRSLMEKRR